MLFLILMSSASAFAKRGTVYEWGVDYVGCYNEQINRDRRHLDIGATDKACRERTRSRFELTAEEATFAVHLAKDNDSLIRLNVKTDTEEEKFTIVFNGTCAGYQPIVPEVKLSARQIVQQLLADPKSKMADFRCYLGKEFRFGFTRVEERCERICDYGRTLQSTKKSETVPNGFECKFCSDVMRDQQKEYGLDEGKDWGIIYSQTNNQSNDCVDVYDCEAGYESVQGQCVTRCQPDWERNKKTLECERGPQVCEKAFQRRMQQSAEKITAVSSTSLTIGFCGPEQLRKYLKELYEKYQPALSKSMSDCHQSPKTEQYWPPAIDEFVAQQLSSTEYGEIVTDRCGQDTPRQILNLFYFGER